MTIKHIVLWKLASEDPAERAKHAATVVEQLEGLIGLIPEIIELSVGANGEQFPNNEWDLALDSLFADAAALKTYNDHPEHQKVVQYVRSVVSARASVDYEL